jgi:hypothetical protein
MSGCLDAALDFKGVALEPSDVTIDKNDTP